MKKLENLPYKQDFDVLNAADINAMLDSIGISYDTAISLYQNIKRINLDLVVCSDKLIKVVDFSIETPWNLEGEQNPTYLMINTEIPEGAEIHVTLERNGETILRETKDSANHIIFYKANIYGISNFRLKMNTENVIVNLKEMVWGW